jgi:ATP-dependent protease HslVU (ClpYQ) ATPase subunit
MQMMKKEKKMKRMAALVEAGVETAEAEATADKFETLEDDAFEAITNLLAAKKAKMEKMEKMTKEVKASDNADTSVLDNAEVNENEVDLSVGGEAEESAVESTRAALVEFVCARLGKKLNKGE